MRFLRHGQSQLHPPHAGPIESGVSPVPRPPPQSKTLARSRGRLELPRGFGLRWVRTPRTLISRLVPVNRNAAFRRQPAAWARVAEILERSLQAAARSDPANARRTSQAAQRGENLSSVNAAFHQRFMVRGEGTHRFVDEAGTARSFASAPHPPECGPPRPRVSSFGCNSRTRLSALRARYALPSSFETAFGGNWVVWLVGVRRRHPRRLSAKA